ncbi:beta-lactamase-like protein [Aspergillus oleicola]
MQLLQRPCMAARCGASSIIGCSRQCRLSQLKSPISALSKSTITTMPATVDFYRRSLRKKRASELPTPATRSFPAPAHNRSPTQRGHENEAAATTTEPTIHSIFEPKTGTWQYIVSDPSTCKAVIIDAVLDYDPATQEITTSSADSLLSLVKQENYVVELVLETHAHADHLTAASYLQARLAEEQGSAPPIGIGERIGQVQQTFGEKYGIDETTYNGVFDRLFKDDETFSVGNLSAKVIHLPGHTPDHLGYMIGHNIFCGDSLFNTDLGTARADFPGGSAEHLYASGRKLLGLPDHVKIYVGHDYPPADREDPVPYMTVGEHKRENKHLKEGTTEEEFVALRRERDGNLAAPKLLHPSLQVNIRAGRLPSPTGLGMRMVHLPLKTGGVEW